MKLMTLSLAVMLSCGVAVAVPLCVQGSCSAESEELAVYPSASLVAFRNVCSRLEPSKARHYSEALDRLTGQSGAHVIAVKSKLFAPAIQSAEAELLEQPIPMIRRDCLRLLIVP